MKSQFIDTLEAVLAASGLTRWWPATEPSPRWVRVRLGEITIAESYRPQLYLDYGPPPYLPTYYFRLDEIQQEYLVDSRRRPDGSTVWTVEAGGQRIDQAAWTHSAPFGNLEPVGTLEPLSGLVTFSWCPGLDWYEEEQKVFGHPRDPHKRVDALPSSRHVSVSIGGTKVADSSRPTLVFETILPTRFYLPPEDVRLDLLEASKTLGGCPYKGMARHWSFTNGDSALSDVAWSYPDPVADNPRIKDLICFYNEKVDLVVDGEPLARPVTPWSEGP